MTEITDPPGTAKTSDAAFRSLRRYNLVAAAVHAVQAIAVVVLSNGFTLPVTASYLQGPPGTPAAAPVTLAEIGVAWAITGFLVLSAVAHLVVASPIFFPRYVRGLRRHRNIFRWVEYSLSASLMIVLIAMIVGISDVAALVTIFGVNATMILFGWLQEHYEEPGSGRWLQYRRLGRWHDYLVGERAYITLSIVAKSLLAWQVFAGTLAG